MYICIVIPLGITYTNITYIIMQQIQSDLHSIGDRFKNPLTKNTNVIIDIKENHFFPGSKTFGNLYILQIENTDRKIELTPAMIKRFEKLS